MEPATAALESGSLFEDRYEILEELGTGSFGCVYRARQRSTGQSVAIKLLSTTEGAESSSERERDRFHREAKICGALSHTNIVPLIGNNVVGGAGAVAPWAEVSVTNDNTAESTVVDADSDGSFNAALVVVSGQTVTVVASDGTNETLTIP